jgi:hypothetical protein
MRRLMRTPAALIVGLVLFSSAAPGQQLTGKEIIRNTDSLLWGKTSVGIFELRVETPHWKRTLRLKAWELDREKSFIRILEPSKERGISTLRIGYEMWNYLPSIERTIKVPPSMMFQPWMGSDFTNDDLVKESSIVKDYDHRVLGTEAPGGEKAYKVEALPKPDAPVVWGKILYWVRTKDFIPVKEEFFNEKGELVRVLTFSGIQRMGGRTIPTVWEMRPVKDEGKRTVFRIIEIRYDIPIDDEIFSLEHLRSPE